MNKTLSKIFIFAAGAATGSVVSWKYFKTKYERIANEEIESVKETFAKNAGVSYDELNYAENDEQVVSEVTKEIADRKKERKAARVAMRNIVKNAGYAEYDEEGDDEMDKPYAIPPEDLGEEYEVESIYYHTDGVLADEQGHVIKNSDELIGKDFAAHFGEYEEDSVFIRNDLLEKDFEILKDYRTYAEAWKVGRISNG